MSKDTDNSLFIDSSVTRLYQQLLSSIGTYEELGTRIVKQIKLHHSFRRTNEIRELSRILVNFPIKEYRLIGQYYLLWCGCREKKYHASILEKVIEQSRTYKTRALQSRAAIEVYQGNFTEALHFYAESFKTQPSMSEYIETTKAIAFIKSVEGFHDKALKDLESLIPILRYAEPFAYFDILNSYAVELGEAGRKDEARNISRVVAASPFIHAYPEWQETAKELKEPNRSFVTVPLIKREPVRIEKTVDHHASQQVAKPKPPADVLPFKLKEAPEPKIPDKLSPREYTEMTLTDKKEMILATVKSGAIDEDDYYKLMIMLGLVRIGPTNKILDLEDEETLDDIAVIWATHVGPENFAAVLSALRDCHDSLRRNEIIDRMIKKAFQQSHESRMTEESWRLKFERRLPER
jgi:hypothetical protein